MFLKIKFREPGKLLNVFISAIKVSVYFIINTQSCGVTTFCEFKVSCRFKKTSWNFKFQKSCFSLSENLFVNALKLSQTNVAIPLARDNLLGLVSNLTSNAVNKFERKLSGTGAVRAGKGFTLSILNEDMNGSIRILASPEDSGVLIDGVTETVKHEK